MQRGTASRRRRRSPPERCDACKLPPSRCECALLPRARPETLVVVIRHAREKKIFCGTGGLVGRVLLGSALVAHADPEAPLDLKSILDPGVDFHILFPSPGAPVLARDLRDRKPGRRLGLIVADGSWPQARKMVQRIPALRGLPFVRLPDGAAPHYALRRAPRQGQLGTAEAVARALDILGEGTAAAALREALAIVADRVLKIRGKRSSMSPPAIADGPRPG